MRVDLEEGRLRKGCGFSKQEKETILPFLFFFCFENPHSCWLLLILWVL